MPMEVFECPDTPPADYPKGYPAMDVINHWNPDDADQVPPTHYLSTCRCCTFFCVVFADPVNILSCNPTSYTALNVQVLYPFCVLLMPSVLCFVTTTSPSPCAVTVPS